MIGLINFASNQLGVDLYTGQQEAIEEWIDTGKRKFLMAVGRRGGKTTIAAVAALYNATVEHYDMPIPGTTRYITVVAPRLDRSREFIDTARKILRGSPDPDLAALFDREHSTQDELAFVTPGGPVVIKSLPASARSTRGDANSLVIMDELASFMSTEEGFAAGRNIYESLMPSLAQFGNRGYAMFLSSPLLSTGIFWDLYQAGLTGAAADLHVTQKTTFDLNPTITRESLAYEEASDPDYFRREYLAEFIEGSGAFLSATAINECVPQRGRVELPPMKGVGYFAACDPAFTGDAFALVIGHRVRKGDDMTYVIDVVRSWQGHKEAPLDSNRVLDEIAAVLKLYGIGEIRSDQYSVVPLSNAMLQRHGIIMRGEPWTNKSKMDAFTAVRRAINTGTIELLDHQRLISELITLETHPLPSGVSRISASGSHHDDLACALASVVYDLSTMDRSSKWYGTGGADADGWIEVYKHQAHERQKQLVEDRQVTIKQTSRQQAEAAMRRAA